MNVGKERTREGLEGRVGDGWTVHSSWLAMLWKEGKKQGKKQMEKQIKREKERYKEEARGRECFWYATAGTVCCTIRYTRHVRAARHELDCTFIER